MMQCIIRYNPSFNMQDQYGNTPLHLAAVAGNYTAASSIIQQHNINTAYKPDANLMINLMSQKGETPLMKAAENGFFNICQLMLCNGADACIRDYNGVTAVEYARNNGFHEIA